MVRSDGRNVWWKFGQLFTEGEGDGMGSWLVDNTHVTSVLKRDDP